MSRFASRELSFVSLGELAAQPTTNTQNCFADAAAGNCTCCTDNSAAPKRLAFDHDLPALQQQLLVALT